MAGPLNLIGGGADTLVFWDQANPNAETYFVTDTQLVTASRVIVGHMENFDTVVLYPSLDPATAIDDAHDPGLYTLVISSDPPPGGGPAAGPASRGGSDARQGLTAQTLPAGVASAAAPVSDAMLADLLSGAAKRARAQRALALDLVWAEAMPALIPDPVLA